MKTLKVLLGIILVLCIALFLYNRFFRLKNLQIYTENGIIDYKVEIASTPEQQQTGLMYREHLAQNTGMIFLFQAPRVANMWMKNTLIPLDMIFFDKTGRIVATHYHANPHDETVISSNVPVAGVLEINAGELERNQIRLNDHLILDNF